MTAHHFAKDFRSGPSGAFGHDPGGGVVFRAVVVEDGAVTGFDLANKLRTTVDAGVWKGTVGGGNLQRSGKGLKAEPSWRQASVAQLNGLSPKSRPPTMASMSPLEFSRTTTALCT